MSLINKMLQDLDARGGAAQRLHEPELKAVPAGEYDSRRVLAAAGSALLVVLLAAGGWSGWKYWQGKAAAHAASTPAQAIASIQPAPITPAPPTAPAAQLTQSAPATPASAAPAQPAAMAAAGGRHKHMASALAGEAAADARPRKEARPRGAKPAGDLAGAASTGAVHDLGPAQLAENTYRRALVVLQEGRVAEAMSDLDRALEIDPRNDAARQTYISLLLENKRPDDAIRQLRLALGIDARQPGLAMILARLQLERNGPALETLQRTLPYADRNADYHALLAGVLQRQQRYAEAAEQYGLALKLSPQNGVWWMGLGISLQADNHKPEAREAYTRARSSPGLTPELQAFIDRKLEQLSR